MKAKSNPQPESDDRIVAVCEACGTPYSAISNPDEEIRLIGTSECSTCGGESFRELTVE